MDWGWGLEVGADLLKKKVLSKHSDQSFLYPEIITDNIFMYFLLVFPISLYILLMLLRSSCLLDFSSCLFQILLYPQHSLIAYFYIFTSNKYKITTTIGSMYQVLYYS